MDDLYYWSHIVFNHSCALQLMYLSFLALVVLQSTLRRTRAWFLALVVLQRTLRRSSDEECERPSFSAIVQSHIWFLTAQCCCR